MKSIRELMIKEFLQIRRDRRMLPLVLLAPVIQVILLGYAATVDVKNISLVVYDADRTPVSREYIRRFTNSGYFTVEAYVDSPDKLDNYLDETKATIAVSIPPNFSTRITQGRTVEVQLLADGSGVTQPVFVTPTGRMRTPRISRSIMRVRLRAGTHNRLWPSSC